MVANAFRNPPLRRRRLGRRCTLSRSAFTLLEIMVATVVLGIALGGLFPLFVVMSRDLQPLRTVHVDGTITYDSTYMSPARDGNTEGTPGVVQPVQHVWYLAPAGDLTATTADPNTTIWVRRLGGSAGFFRPK